MSIFESVMQVISKTISTFFGNTETQKRAQRRAANLKMQMMAFKAAQLPQYQAGYTPQGFPNMVATYQRGVISRAEFDKLSPQGNLNLVTYCNILARDFLDSRMPKVWIMGWLIGGEGSQIPDGYDYDIRCLRPGSSLVDVINNTLPDKAYLAAKAACAAGILTEHTAEQAQERANNGVPIWMCTAKYGHEAVVIADIDASGDPNPYNAAEGPLIVQAGRFTGVYKMCRPSALGNSWIDPEIKYYEFPLYV